MNSQKILRIITGMSVALLMAGCAEHNDVFGNQTTVEPITVYGEIEQQYVTRANDGGFGDGDRIGVFVVDYDGGKPQALQRKGNRADNVAFTFDGASGLWTGSTTLYWKDDKTPVDAYGYYPFSSELISVDAYPIIISQRQDKSDGYEQSDFLWAKSENVAPDTPIRLKHKHVMAGIRVNLIEGTGFEKDEWTSVEKNVLIQNTYTNATIDLSTGIVSLSGSETVAITAMTNGDSYRAVVAPQTVAAGLPLLSITVDGTPYKYTRKESTIYYSGRLHNFAIKVNKRTPSGDYELVLVSESVTAWENDPVSHNGEAKEYVVVNIEDGQYLGDVIKNMGLDAERIVNLKLVGEMSAEDNWYWGDGTGEEDLSKQTNLSFIRHQLPNLEALNLKELRLKNGSPDSYAYTIDDWIRQNLDYTLDGGYDDIIPFKAFFGIHTLSSVVFPDRLIVIGNDAFQGCNLRNSCILPEGLKLIGDNAFSVADVPENSGGGYSVKQESRCHMTGDLYIPSSVEYIGEYAFYKQDFTNELVLPEKMSSLGNCAFGGCKYMTGYLRIPEGLKEVNGAWWGMTGLQGWAEVPQGVTKINGIGCPMASLHIPEGVTEIKDIMGYNYPNAESDFDINYPYKEWRRALREIFLPTTLKTLGESAFAYTSISHIHIPEGIEMIPKYCFAQCDELQDTLYIPSTVYRIQERAFRACHKLTAVVIPANVAFIDDLAFGDCFSLDYIQCLGSTPPEISSTAFDGVEKNNFTLVVPEGAVDAYRNAEGWKEFKRISAYRNFVCRPMKEKLLNKGHQYEMVLNADGKWSVTHCPQWAHVSATSGNKKTALTVTVDDLKHGDGNRKDSIIFTLSGVTNEEGKPVTCYYELSQYDYQYDEDVELTLQKATRGNGKVNIFLCGDGYDAQDIAEGKYLADMRQETEYFFAIEPYLTYKDYFNVYVGFAMSRESGINSTNQWRETKFETKMGNSCSDIRLEPNFDDAMIYALTVSPQIMPDGNSAPLVIMALNTEKYEGVTSMWGDGSAVAVCPMSTWDYPYDARGIVQHEAGGHGFGKLADEYIYHPNYIQTCRCICCEHVPGLMGMKNMGWARNLSLSGKYKDVEWRQLIFDNHYGDICDIYEGGYFHQRGVFRSEFNSCMNNNVPYFSTVSRMAIVERIKQYAGETFNYDDFVAKDSREYGDKFITRNASAEASQSASHAMHLSAPVMKKGSVKDLKKRKVKK